MKKKIIGILVCMMLMAIIPLAAGAAQPETEGLIKERIIMRGVILNPHTSLGGKFAFFGVRVHYTSIGPQGIKTGVVLLQKLTLPDSPNGLITNGYMLVSFRGKISDII